MPCLGDLVGFVRYFGIALAGVLLDWTVFALIIHLTDLAIAAQATSRAAGAVLAFWGFRRHVFLVSHQQAWAGEVKRFCIALFVAYLASMGLLWGFSLGLPLWAAKLATDGTTFVANWFVMRHYVFRDGAKEGGADGGSTQRDIDRHLGMS